MSAPEAPALRRPGFCDGIDLSAVQTISDAQKVADAGFLFAYVKASEGLNYCDPKRLDLLQKLRDVGIITSVYGYAKPSQGQPRVQAQNLSACSGDVYASRPVLDLEAAPADWSPQQLVDFAEEFIEECETQGLLEACFYSYGSFTDRMQPALGLSRLGRCPLFIARYQSTTAPWAPPVGFRPPVPKPWPDWTIHQYSGNGGFRVPGIVGDCDRDLFNGGYAALRAFFGLFDPEAETLRELPNPASEPTLHVMPDTLDAWNKRDE